MDQPPEPSGPPGLPDLPAALTERVAFLLQLALTRAHAMAEEVLADLQLTGREYGVLAMLEAGGPAPAAQHRLGAALGIDRTTTVALLRGLQARGLIQRSRHPANRRAYHIALTAAGEQLRDRTAAVLADCDDRFLAPLPAAEREHLRTLLRALL